MGFTFVNKGGTGGSGSSTTLALVVTGIHAGDLIVVGVKWEGGDTTVSVSDGTTTLTADPDGHNSRGLNDPRSCVFYLLSSVASGSVTYTVTFGAARSWRSITVMAYTPSASCTLEDSHSGNGSSTAVNSGNIITVGTDGLAFGFYGEFGSALTSPLINGVAPDQTQVSGGPDSQRDTLWSKSYSSGFTGAASGTISSLDWLCTAIAFKIAGGGGGGGGARLSRLANLGAG